ncbi:HAD family hydrolase [Comamonadaceae bacterium OH2310_COT-174]|uniref:HAD family hydrolase n=1 Tax=Vandammella animalimorsus TaxID=2029117 RepID=A0A2A2A765_9BURK|nr:HAD family hydrolase [Vandammella animalimorsus]PAT33612.1 HAD family hydrolase [Vandammella animalimorsus]RRD68201.1 HAD family hydrolase [Comamonadaceae bacterium OH2310_COT-174]
MPLDTHSLPFDAVLFDCDGVLVDSEGITNQVLCQMLNEAGWALDYAQCFALFHGRAVRDQRERIEAETGQPLTEAWMADFYARRNARLSAELQPEPGAPQAVQALHRQFAGRIACASGGDRHKLDLQLQKVGLWRYFEGRIFSGQDLPRNKPFPDVYLQAAAAVGVAPERCLVVEDSVPGSRAGLAAGATVIGYDKSGHYTPAMRQAGVQHFITHMSELPQAIAALARALA